MRSGPVRRRAKRVEVLEQRRLLTAAYHLTFDDEFNSLNLSAGANSSGWLTCDYNTSPYLGSEQEYYCLQNGPTFHDAYNPFSVSNGVLSITAQPNKDANNNPIVTTTTNPKYLTDTQPYLSGELTTSTGYAGGTYPQSAGFSQKFGYFEIRAKLPSGQGMWPAFWMMPADGTSMAEYDVFEVPVKNGSSTINTQNIYQSVHWGGYTGGDPHVNSDGYDYNTGTVDASTGFHTYGFEWTPTTVTWYVDGVATQSQTNRCEKAMYMMINLAIGGSWPGSADGTTPWPAKMDVDYVRAWSADTDLPAVTAQTGYQAVIPATVGTVDAAGTTYGGLPQGSFETTFSTNGYVANPAGTNWAFNGTSGIVKNGTGSMTNPSAPDGYSAALLEQTGSVSQTFTTSATASGTYNLSFQLGSRGFTTNDVSILVDGVSIGTFNSPATKVYAAQSTANFTLTAGTHTITFAGLNTGGGDRIAFLDDVTLNAVSINGTSLLAPTGLTATTPSGTTEGQVVLNWTNPSGSNATGYVIERRLNNAASTYTPIAVISSAATTTYTDSISSEPTKYGGTWTYRVYATNNSNGVVTTAFSQSAAVTMPSPDAANTVTPLAPPVGLGVSNLAARSLTLTWLDASYFATNFVIERKTGAAGTWSTLVTIGSTGGALYNDSGLNAGTTYYYRVSTKGESITGTASPYTVVAITSAPSAEISVTTSANVAPLAPTAFKALAGGFTTASLSWVAPTDVPVLGYNVYRGTTAGGESATPINGGSLITGTTYTDSGLTMGTAYYYTVKAVNAYGSSPAATESKTVPESVNGLVLFDDALQNNFIFAGTTVPASVSSPVYLGTSAFGATEAAAGNTIGLGISGTVPSIPIGQTALEFALYIANGTSVSSISLQLQAPSYATATYNSANSTKWTVDGHAGSTAMSAGSWHLVRLDLAAGFGSNLIPGSTKIRSFNVSTSIASQTVYLDNTRFVPYAAPAVPTNLVATAASGSGIDLTWTASPGDQALYNIYRGTTPGGESATAINPSPVSTSSYNDTGLATNATYYYFIKAYNAAGTSSASGEASATTQVAAPTAPTGLTATAASTTSINLSWTAPAGTVTGYNVYRGTTAGGESATPINGATLITATTYSDTGLTAGTTYYYVVRAVNGAGPSPASAEASATTQTAAPAAPTALTATPVSTSGINLSWTAPAGTVTGYNAYRGTTAGGESATPINGATLITGTTYANSGLAGGTRYYYVVRAVNGGGPSSASAEASTMTFGAPTNIALSSNVVAENMPAATVVGTLSATDPNVGDTFTFTLVSGTGSADNASFQVSGSQLQTAAIFDFEARSSYSIRLRVTDQTSQSYEKVFAISIGDVAEPLVINATSGNDVVALSASGANLVVTINGVPTSYPLAKQSSITVNLLGGADTLTVGTGVPQIVAYGGDGNDTMTGGDGNDTMFAGAGNDVLHGGAGHDALRGEDGNDTLYGELGDDRLYGDKGYDYLAGGDGADRLDGGTGNDTLYGGLNQDSLLGMAGYDKLYGEDGKDTLDGGDQDDTLDGGNGWDSLIGGTGNDILFAIDTTAYSDTLLGGGGTDTAHVDTNDILTGITTVLYT